MGAGRLLLSVQKGQELVDGTTQGTWAEAEDIGTYSQHWAWGQWGGCLRGRGVPGRLRYISAAD